MKNKILSSLLVFVLGTMLLCSCGNKNNENNDTSSKTAEKEYSSQVTSSENEASSEKEEVSSKDETSSKEEVDDTSSKKGFTRPSESDSESIKVTIDPKKSRGIGVYHFSPDWADHYSEKPTDEERYEEFEDVLKEGYFNTVIGSNFTEARFWEICEKYDVTVWMNIWTLYDTNSTKPEINDLDKYVANIDKTVSVIKANPKWWDRFQGFCYDEPIWRGQSNDDYLALTKALYLKYGKRNFPVFATGVLIGVEGNELQLGQGADAQKKVLPYALEYTTDVAFDSYSVDVRDGASNGGYIDRVRKEANLPDIVDGKSYYKEIADMMLRLTGHSANLWFYPTAYRTYLWGGLNGVMYSDEEYCIAHLEYLHDLLDEYDYKGGLILYNYQKFSNAHALAEVLVVKDENGRYKLCPDGYEGRKWKNYSYLIKEITKEYKTNEARVLQTLEGK